MAFANEIRDFVSTFRAGADVVNSIKNRQRAERAQEIQQEQFDRNYGLAERRIGNQESQFEQTHGLNERRVDLYGNQIKATQDYQQAQAEENKRRWELEQERQAGLDLETRRKTRFDEERLTRADRLAEYNAAVKAYNDKLANDPASIADTPPPDPTAYGLGAAGLTSGIPAGPESFGPRTLPGEVRSGIPTGPGAGAGPTPVEPPASEEETGEYLEPSASAATGVVGGGELTMEDIGLSDADLHGALKDGVNYLQDYYGLKQAGVQAGADVQSGQAALMAGREASDPYEREEVDYVLDDMDRANGLDPDQMSDRLKAIRRVAKAWKIYKDKGDNDNAAKMAANMLMQARHESAMLAASAEVKIKKGDMSGGLVDLKKAEELTPNGRSVEFDEETGRYRFIDDITGKTIGEGLASPEDILGAAVGMKDGRLFFRSVLDSIKDKDQRAQLSEPMPFEDPEAEQLELPRRDKKASEVVADLEEGVEGEEGTGGAGAPITPLGKASIDETIARTLTESKPLQEALGGMSWPEMQAKMGPERVTSLHELARLITEYNNVSPEKAAQVAISLADPDPTGETHPRKRAWNFKMLEGSNEDAMAIRAEDGTTVILPTRVATSALYNASKGLNDLAITGASQTRVNKGVAKTREELWQRGEEGSPEGTPEGRYGRARGRAAREAELGATMDDRGGRIVPRGETALGAGIDVISRPAPDPNEPLPESAATTIKKAIQSALPVPDEPLPGESPIGYVGRKVRGKAQEAGQRKKEQRKKLRDYYRKRPGQND